MKDNKGFSLVELLVAILLAAIVAGSVGYLLTTSLRMFKKETVNVELQQELQVTLNQIVDYAMESEAIISDFDGTYPDYLALGTYDGTSLKSQIIWQDGNKIYLKKADVSGFLLSDNPAEADFRKIDVSTIEALIPSEGSSADVNLLAQYVKDNAFKVTGVDGIVDIKDESGAVIGQAFENPLSINIELVFEKRANAENKEKRVNDRATLRNRVFNDISVDGVEYALKKEDSLNITTETVNNEIKTGILQIEGEETGGTKMDLNILEIVPDYSYDYLQYVLGGKNGALLNTENTYYGASAGANQSPVTSEELEGYLIRTAGVEGGNTVFSETGFYPNNSVSLKAIEYLDDVSRVGYYEYVGANKGSYAIDSVKLERTPASSAGMGNVKPVIDKFVYGNTSSSGYTGKYYNPQFVMVGPADDRSSDENGYYAPTEINDGSARKDYTKRSVTYDLGPYDKRTKDVYEYVGPGQGDVAVTFVYAGTDYNYYYNCYKLSGDLYSFFDPDNASYSASVSSWEYLGYESNSSTPGYDYVDTIKDVVMYSKYHTYSPSLSSDFGWIWHEAEYDSTMYYSIKNRDITTSATIVNNKIYESSSDIDDKRIYLASHKRPALVNNEVFKLFTMQDIFESYTPNNMMDIRYGLWNTDTDEYCQVNHDALIAWENAGYKVTLNVRTPLDVTDADIADNDLFIIGVNGDGGFDFAHGLTNDIRNSSFNGSYSSSNDITFKQTVDIYKKIISEKAAIACPYTLISAGGAKASTNIAKLFEMLYCVSNASIERDSIVLDTVEAAKKKKIEKQGESSNYWTVDPSYQSALADRVMVNGSGRELFTDYLLSMENKALSKNLYDDNTLATKTTDIIYIAEDGADAGSIVMPAKNETIDGYNFSNGTIVTSTWGGGGGASYNKGNGTIEGDGLSAFDSNILQWNQNHFLADRYRKEYSGYDKNHAYVWNGDYGYDYKFYYSEPQEGIYRNQLVWNQTSDLLSFSKSGNGGALGLQTIKANSHPDAAGKPADIIGTITYVGADDKEAAELRRANQGDTTTKHFEDMPDYKYNIVSIGDSEDKKVLYLTEAEFKKAQNEGLYLYVLIKTSKDPSYYNKCVLRYNKNEKDAEGNPETGRFDYKAYDYGLVNDLTNENAIQYMSGTETDETYVYEYRYHANPEYFCNLTPPHNYKNNLVVARIDKSSEREYQGHDDLYIVIRDTFDLD